MTSKRGIALNHTSKKSFFSFWFVSNISVFFFELKTKMAQGPFVVNYDNAKGLQSAVSKALKLGEVECRRWDFIHRASKERIHGSQYSMKVKSKYSGGPLMFSIRNLRMLSGIHHKGKKRAGFANLTILTDEQRQNFEALDNALMKSCLQQFNAHLTKSLHRQINHLRDVLKSVPEEKKEAVNQRIQETEEHLSRLPCESWQSIIRQGDLREEPDEYGNMRYPDYVVVNCPFAVQVHDTFNGVTKKTVPPTAVVSAETQIPLSWAGLSNVTFDCVVLSPSKLIWNRDNQVMVQLDALRMVVSEQASMTTFVVGGPGDMDEDEKEEKQTLDDEDDDDEDENDDDVSMSDTDSEMSVSISKPTKKSNNRVSLKKHVSKKRKQ